MSRISPMVNDAEPNRPPTATAVLSNPLWKRIEEDISWTLQISQLITPWRARLAIRGQPNGFSMEVILSNGSPKVDSSGFTECVCLFFCLNGRALNVCHVQ